MDQSVIHAFENAAGANNCFLNSVLHVLWGVRPFRARLLTADAAHRCGPHCVTCSLRTLFTHLKHADERVIQPNILRDALAHVDFDRFGLTKMSDASECFTAILEELHRFACKGSDVGCSDPPCLAHEFFGINVAAQAQCSCGYMSEPIVSYEFVEYFQASSIRDIKSHNSSRTFGEVLFIASKDNLKRCEVSGCGRTTINSRWLLNEPKVLSVALSWETNRSDAADVMELLAAIDERLHLKQLFLTDSTSSVNLCSMVCYYGMHYVVYAWKQGKWLLFSDEHVQTIGSSFVDHVVTHCITNTYQPVLLIYENKKALYPDVDEQTSASAALPASSSAAAKPSMVSSGAKPTDQMVTSTGKPAASTPSGFAASSSSYLYSSTASNTAYPARRERVVHPASSVSPAQTYQPAQPSSYAPYQSSASSTSQGSQYPYGASASSHYGASDYHNGTSTFQNYTPSNHSTHHPSHVSYGGYSSAPSHAASGSYAARGDSAPVTQHQMGHQPRTDFQKPPRLQISPVCLLCKCPNTSTTSNYCDECWRRSRQTPR